MTTLPHIKVTAAGTLGTASGNEIWTCGIKVGVQAAFGDGTLVTPTEDDLNALVGPAQNAWSAYFNTGSLIYSTGILTHLYCTAIGPDGLKIPGIDTVIFDYLSGVPGKSLPGGAAPLYQMTLSTTMRGDLYSRGLAAYGRFFPPVPDMIHDATGSSFDIQQGLMQTAVATKFANAGVTLLQALEVSPAPSGYMGPALVSSTLATPRWQPVTSVEVDLRPDTQRRRANALESAPVVSVPLS